MSSTPQDELDVNMFMYMIGERRVVINQYSQKLHFRFTGSDRYKNVSIPNLDYRYKL
jgi:hypothetical protein